MRYVYTVVLLVFVSLTVSAQESGFSLRFRTAYGASWLRGEVPVKSLDPAGQDCNCPDYTEFSGSYASQTLGLDFNLAEVMHIGLDLGVQSQSGQQTVPDDSLPSLDPDGGVVLSITEWNGSVSMLDAKTRLYVALDLPSSFFVEVGVSAVMNLSHRAQSVLRLVEPDNATFDPDVYPGLEIFDEGRAVMFYDRELPEFPSARFDIDASVGKYFVIGDVTIQLLATYQHGLMSLTNVRSLKSNSLAGSLGFMYAL